MYCVLESMELVFDPFFDVRLNDSSIRKTVKVQSSEECAQTCLNQKDFACISFDVVTMVTEIQCAMAESGFDVMPNERVREPSKRRSDTGNVIHFERDPKPGRKKCLSQIVFPSRSMYERSKPHYVP